MKTFLTYWLILFALLMAVISGCTVESIEPQAEPASSDHVGGSEALSPTGSEASEKEPGSAANPNTAAPETACPTPTITPTLSINSGPSIASDESTNESITEATEGQAGQARVGPAEEEISVDETLPSPDDPASLEDFNLAPDKAPGEHDPVVGPQGGETMPEEIVPPNPPDPILEGDNTTDLTATATPCP